MESGVIYDDNGNEIERLPIEESPLEKLRAENPEEYEANEKRFNELGEIVRWGYFVGDYMGQIQLEGFVKAIEEQKKLAVKLGFAEVIK